MYNSRSWPAMGSCDSDPRDYFKGLTLPNEPNSCSQKPRNLPTNQSTSNQNVPTRGSEFWFLDKEVNIRQTGANNRHLWFKEGTTLVRLESNTGGNYPWIIRRLEGSNYYSIQCIGDCQIDGVRYQWLNGRLQHRGIVLLVEHYRVPNDDKFLKWEIIESEPNVYMFRSISSKCWLDGGSENDSDDSPAIVNEDNNVNQYFAIEELYISPTVASESGMLHQLRSFFFESK
ncbi:hypothetical protein BC833DRAFT_626126 [Globomyces pollinis-pini]|nr:hypothetical protein BC833DRAFT_626126 [Globomyces pollinis-pini]